MARPGAGSPVRARAAFSRPLPGGRRGPGLAVSESSRRTGAWRPTSGPSAADKPRPRPGTDDRPASKDGAMRCRLKERMKPGAAPERAGRGNRASVHCRAISRPGLPRSREDGCARRDDCSIAAGAFDRLRSAPRATGAASTAPRPAAHGPAKRIAARRGGAMRAPGWGREPWLRCVGCGRVCSHVVLQDLGPRHSG